MQLRVVRPHGAGVEEIGRVLLQQQERGEARAGQGGGRMGMDVDFDEEDGRVLRVSNLMWVEGAYFAAGSNWMSANATDVQNWFDIASYVLQ